MEIFKLVGSIMVDSSDAENSISKTGEKAEGMGSKLVSGAKTAAKWAAGVTTAAVAVGGAMVSAAKDTAAEMDVIDKGAQRMKISAESYQELSYAAGLCGVEMSTMERAAKKLEGTDMNLDDAMKEIMALSTEEERAAKAAELFGESVAYQMTPLLNAGAEGFEQMKQEANDLGLVMSGEAVAAGAEMNDQFSKVEQSVNALKTNLVSSFMPYVSQILDWVIKNMPRIQQTISSVLNAIMPILTPILDAIMDFLPVFLDLFTSVMSAITPPLEWIIGLISEAISGAVALIQTAGGWLGKLFGGGGSENSHAAGLTTVPYDNYPANLHKGETVLNANESADLVSVLKDIKNGSYGSSEPATIVVQTVLDGKVVGESVTKYQRQKARAYG